MIELDKGLTGQESDFAAYRCRLIEKKTPAVAAAAGIFERRAGLRPAPSFHQVDIHGSLASMVYTTGVLAHRRG